METCDMDEIRSYLWNAFSAAVTYLAYKLQPCSSTTWNVAIGIVPPIDMANVVGDNWRCLGSGFSRKVYGAWCKNDAILPSIGKITFLRYWDIYP